MTYFKHLCAEGFGIFGLNCIFFESFYEFVNAVKLQAGAEEARKNLSQFNYFGYFFFIYFFAAEIFLHQALAAKCHVLRHSFLVAEINKFAVKLGIKVFDYLLAALSCEVHFSHKNKCRNVVELQKLP